MLTTFIKKALLVAVHFCALMPLSADLFTFPITVFDQRTFNPVPGVTVQITQGLTDFGDGTTDNDGKVTITFNAPPNTKQFVAKTFGAGTVIRLFPVTPGAQNDVPVMKGFATVSGKVLLQGKPVPNATVNVYEKKFPYIPLATATTGPNGQYKVTGLAPDAPKNAYIIAPADTVVKIRSPKLKTRHTKGVNIHL